MLSNKHLIVSATSLKEWNVLRPTENAERYESSLWPANQERIIELDSDPRITEIEIVEHNEGQGTVECQVSYNNGKSKRLTLLSRKMEELVYRDKPALTVVE